jgi:hypothetical protein
MLDVLTGTAGAASESRRAPQARRFAATSGAGPRQWLRHLSAGCSAPFPISLSRSP